MALLCTAALLARVASSGSAPVAEVVQVEVPQHHSRAQQRRSGVGDALARNVLAHMPGSLRSSHVQAECKLAATYMCLADSVTAPQSIAAHVQLTMPCGLLLLALSQLQCLCATLSLQQRVRAHLLEDGDVAAHVDAWQHAWATSQASHHVGYQVAIQVGRHLRSLQWVADMPCIGEDASAGMPQESTCRACCIAVELRHNGCRLLSCQPSQAAMSCAAGHIRTMTSNWCGLPASCMQVLSTIISSAVIVG